jgi:hypothetical protein
VLGGGTSNTSIYDPGANTFTAGPALEGGAGASDDNAGSGAHALQRPDGKFLVILANGSNKTSIYDAGWLSGTTAQNGTVGTYESEDLNPASISSWDKMSWVKTVDNTIQASDNTVDAVEVKTATTQGGLALATYRNVTNGGSIGAGAGEVWLKVKVTFRRDPPLWTRVDHSGAKVWLGENDTKENRAFPVPDVQSLTVTYNTQAGGSTRRLILID